MPEDFSCNAPGVTDGPGMHAVGEQFARGQVFLQKSRRILRMHFRLVQGKMPEPFETCSLSEHD